MNGRLLSRRHFLQLSGAGALAALVAACAPQAPTAAPTAKVEVAATALPAKLTGSIVFWAVEAGASAKSNNLTWLQWIEKKFNDAGTGITCKGEAGEWNEPNKSMAAIAAGTTPDTSFTGRHLTADLAARRAIRNLDDAVAGAKTFTWDNIWSRLQKDALTWGKKWIIPYSTDTRALFYNKAIMADAGLDPAKPPETLEQMAEMSAKISKKDSAGRLTRCGYTPSFGNPPVHLSFYSALWALGSNTVDADIRKCTILDKGEQAMIYLKTMMDAQGGYEQAVAFTNAISPAPGLDAFSSGLVGLAMLTNGAPAVYKNAIKDFEWGMVMGPHFEGLTEPYNYDGGGGWLFFSKSKNFDLAWQFVEFFMDPPVYLEFADTYSSMPARQDVGADWAKKAPDERQIFLDTANTVHWIPIYAGIMEEIGNVATMFNNCLIGGKPIGNELEACRAKNQILLDKWAAFEVPS